MLTPLKPVQSPEDIVVGRDGVVLRKSGRSAVFLPQAAVAQGWRREELLTQLCRKAGLPETACQRDAAIYTFRAQVFGESQPQP